MHTSRLFNLTPGINDIPLSGRLIDQTGNQTALDILGELFSAYLNGYTSPVVAVGREMTLADGSHVTWLDRAITKLQLQVAFASPTGAISPIKSITLGTLGLAFDPSGRQSYAPIMTSNTTFASFGLPFGFDLNITNVAVNMGIINRGMFVANLSTPYGASQTFVENQNAGYESGTITLSIPPAPLVVADTYDAHLAFSQFQFDLFDGNGSQFLLGGETNAVTATPIGEVTLKDINFAVPAGLIGLSKLQTAPTEIVSVDVIGGTPDQLVLGIQVGMTNPSNLILDVGDVTLQLFDQLNGAFLGRAVLPALHMAVGHQVRPSIGYFQANSNPTALGILTKVRRAAVSHRIGADHQAAI